MPPMKHKILLAGIMLMALSLASCSDEKPVMSVPDFTLPEGPSLHDISYENAPIYFYLFTHTEDHFNHELSEERYWRGGEILSSLAKEYPETVPTWTIEFQGADAKSITDRNEETGLIDYLLGLKDAGLVEFGYHAHHDPSYMNRPQKELSKNFTWDEAYSAIHTWVTCEKDPLYGGCVAEDGGGLQAILNSFGQVEVVTGVGLTDGALIERSAGSQAIKDELPDRWLGFGFPDHGAALEGQNYSEVRDEFMTLLSPTADTSSGTLWLDNAIRINDGAPVEGTESINAEKGVRTAAQKLDGVTRNSPIVLNVGYASKYVYTVTGTSPTKYGYANPEDPELPDEWLESRKNIELAYSEIEKTLNYLLGEFLPKNEGSQFVNSDEVVELFTSDDFWHVDEDELYQMSLWLLNEWTDSPPVYAYDGEDFYSLTDAFFLLQEGLQGNFPENGIVSEYMGPWSEAKSESAGMMWTDDLEKWITKFDKNTIPETIEIGDREWNSAQVLYALAYFYATDYKNQAQDSISIGVSSAETEASGLLEDLGCSNCLDTAWSLKPARFQD